MSFSRAVTSAAFVLVLSIAVLGGAVAQSTPPSLVLNPGPLFLKVDKSLNGTADGGAPCGTGLTGQATGTTTGGGDWSFDPSMSPVFARGTAKHYHVPDAFSVSVGFTAANPQAPVASSGFKIKGSASSGAAKVDSAEVTVAPTPPGTAPATQSLSFTPTNFTAHEGGPLKVTITITPFANAAAPSQAGAYNLAIACGANSKADGVKLVRGMPGDGDIDADGIPDADDPDRDNDNATNTAEAASVFAKTAGAKGPFDCATQLSPAPQDNPGVTPGKDSDGDGTNDEVECKAGYNPTNAQQAPPPPRTILQILMPIIIILLILGLIAALVFVFLKFGKTVTVSVLSTPELFIPAGTKGKYELSVQNLSKKGDPRTYQLAVSGLPEGWDAKLNVDHVTLDPQGGVNNQGRIWLEVESPVHSDPESAVVTVKAMPLNKAGRKDSMKLPGRASTITSINLPPGSKVPVKRGGKVAAAKPKDEAPAAPAGPSGDQAPVIAVEGVGETYGPKLNKAGIMTVGDLRKADPAMVAKKTGAPPPTVASWQQMCELMQIEGVGPQFSEQLVRSGVTSIAQLAQQKPKELVAQIEKTNAAREVPIQGSGIQDKQAKNFVKAAERWMKDHAAPAAAAPAAAASAAAAAPTSGAKPQLQVGGLKHDPPAFRQGESVKSSVSVSNNGKDKSTIKLSLYVNDGLADVQTVTVKPGKASDVQFKWTAQEKNKLNIRGELVSQ